MKLFFLKCLLIGLSIFVSTNILAETLYPDVPRISADTAYKKYKTGEVILVDTMKPETFAQKHILGAINIPNDNSEDREYIKNTDFPFSIDQEIILYCM